MYIFHDSDLNLWRFHPGELPEKPIFNFNYYDQASTKAYDVKLYNYNAVIAAIKQNALTIGNPEICPQNMSAVEPDKFYKWIGNYDTKRCIVNGGVEKMHETITVAILTLPEKKKNTMGNSAHGFTEGAEEESFQGFEDNFNILTEGMKITPERAKEVEDKKWSLSRMFNDDVLMFDGCISAITIEEICDKLNELESTRDQLAKQEVAFRETVKLQFEEKESLRSILKEIEFLVYSEGLTTHERFMEIKNKFPKR